MYGKMAVTYTTWNQKYEYIYISCLLTWTFIYTNYQWLEWNFKFHSCKYVMLYSFYMHWNDYIFIDIQNLPIVKLYDHRHATHNNPPPFLRRRVRSAPSICLIQPFTFPVVLIPFIRHKKHRIQEKRRPRASSYLGSPTSSIPLLRLRNSLLRGKFKIKIYSSMRV